LRVAALIHPLNHASRFFVFHCYADHRDLHSFPTRRSSDLMPHSAIEAGLADLCVSPVEIADELNRLAKHSFGSSKRPEKTFNQRSEEHTSELQSQSNLVCRLLLEKKKTRIIKPRAPAT